MQDLSQKSMSTTRLFAEENFDAVLIGGSAGALEVLHDVLPGLSARLAATVVVLVHQPPDADGVLAEVLAGFTALPVKTAEDKEVLQPGSLHVAPSDYHLLIENERSFALSIDEPLHFSRPSIDVLFESAADVYGARLLAVLLSGASADGARGLQTVRQAGGTTVVQRPDSASVAYMPNAALALGRPTHVYDPDQISAMLRALPAARE